MISISPNRVIELTLTSAQPYDAPEREIELDAIVTTPSGQTYIRPGFWNGGDEWRIRVAAEEAGVYTLRTVCSDSSNASLHGHTEMFDAAKYSGDNALLAHGRVKIAANGRTFEYADGTPFFWLADTWWMALCRRLAFPDEFGELVADRVAKGFNTVQIVAGLYPDMDPFDERGANEAGFPWTTDFSRIEPAFFTMADRRFDALVSAGLMPCIVGCWGYYLHAAGPEAVCVHWRYLVARYGALPVTWCLCGEALMPHYTQEFASDDARAEHIAWLKSEWSVVGRYVREIDAARHPITVHPGGHGGVSTRQMVEDDAYDFVWLQTGHHAPDAYPPTRDAIQADYDALPTRPVINSEVCYEGIMEGRQEAQRYLFWTCVLGGAAGHTYGANGIWQLNGHETPYGPSPHGLSWGDTPWREAYKLPGSGHVGVGKKIITRYEWWRFTPHPEWIAPASAAADLIRAFAGGIPGELRIIYWPPPLAFGTPTLLEMEPGVRYTATLIDPIHGDERPLGPVEFDGDGKWQLPFRFMPRAQDWVFVLERV